MKKGLKIILMLSLFFCSLNVIAQENPTSDNERILNEPLPESNPTEFEPGKFYAEFFKMMFMLGIIIFFLLMLMWFVKRFLNAKITQSNKNSPIQVIEIRPISQRTSLYMVDINDQRILVAESHTGSVSMLEIKKNP